MLVERLVWLSISITLTLVAGIYLIRKGWWLLFLIAMATGATAGWLSIKLWPYCCP